MEEGNINLKTQSQRQVETNQNNGRFGLVWFGFPQRKIQEKFHKEGQAEETRHEEKMHLLE